MCDITVEDAVLLVVVRMRLRLLGISSGGNGTGCPTLYATDRGTYVVQGKLVTDEEAIADLVDVRFAHIPAR